MEIKNENILKFKKWHWRSSYGVYIFIIENYKHFYDKLKTGNFY